MQLRGQLEDLVHARAFESADEEQRGEVDVLEMARGLLPQPLGLALLVAHQIPFVDAEDDGAAALLGLRGDPGVLLHAQLRRIGEHDHDVGALDRPQRALGREDFDLVDHVALLAQAGRVGEQEAAAFPDELLVDRVPRRAGQRRCDEALFADQPVEQRALADVWPSQHGKMDDALLRLPLRSNPGATTGAPPGSGVGNDRRQPG